MLLVSSLLGASALDQDAVDLGIAGDFAILTKTGVTTTGSTSVTGDIGTSPIAAAAITGFALALHASGTFSTSSLVIGKVYAADYDPPTPAEMTTAISDMETAYTNAASRASPDIVGLGSGLIDGNVLTPGLYKWVSNVEFASLTFCGDAMDVWILQIEGDLIVSEGALITLVGGAKEKNIFWQVAGSTSLMTTAAMKGIILCATSIDFLSGSSLDGAALAQSEVTLDATTVVKSTSN